MGMYRDSDTLTLTLAGNSEVGGFDVALEAIGRQPNAEDAVARSTETMGCMFTTRGLYRWPTPLRISPYQPALS